MKSKITLLLITLFSLSFTALADEYRFGGVYVNRERIPDEYVPEEISKGPSINILYVSDTKALLLVPDESEPMELTSDNGVEYYAITSNQLAVLADRKNGSLIIAAPKEGDNEVFIVYFKE